MKTYADILNKMNLKVSQLADEVKKLENNLFNTQDIINYLITYNEQKEVREIYHNFFSYCVRNDFDLDSEFNDITLNK